VCFGYCRPLKLAVSISGSGSVDMALGEVRFLQTREHERGGRAVAQRRFYQPRLRRAGKRHKTIDFYHRVLGRACDDGAVSVRIRI